MMRPAPRCDACGIASSTDIRSLTLLRDGCLDKQARLCPACLDDVRESWRAIVEGGRLVKVGRG